ncbi:MAG: cyclic nucleotide-binding domain-containing protein [Terracidiphilus sp.]|nr:cyclic nucleotide-binding domain-containing protein [Terracidiphilus sp.]
MNLDPSAFVADPELIKALDRHSLPIVCEEDRILFHQGEAPDGLYILNTGDATLSMTTPGGDSVVSMHVVAGSLLGLPGVISNQPYTLTAIAHNGARLSYVCRDEFTALMQTEPLLSLRILQVLAAEVSSARRALVDL